MDKSMTGDGAVVREWDPDSFSPYLNRWAREHNALVRHALAQAAEIERLTTGGAAWFENAEHFRKRAEASEARAADLLKALEGIAEMRSLTLIKPSMGSLYDTGHQEGANKAFGQAADIADYAIAAAKGETVADRSMLEVPPYKGAGR